MKKLLLIAFVLFGYFGNAQVLGADMFNGNPKTTTERDAITITQGLMNGSIVVNETTQTLDLYIGGSWVSLGGGTAYTFSTGLTNDNGTVSVTNPFTPDLYLPKTGGNITGTITPILSSVNLGSSGNLFGSIYSSRSYIGNLYPIATEIDMYGDIDMQNRSIKNLTTPVNDQDAATKAYVDSSGGGGGTDDQTASEVPFNKVGSYPSFVTENTELNATNVEAALKRLHISKASGIGLSGNQIRLTSNGDTELIASVDLTPILGSSTSLTGYHSINTLTTDITAAYSNQVTGSGYRVVNTVSGTTDIDVTINNLRSSLINENYSFVSNSSGSTIELLEGTASFVGKGQSTNNAVRVTDYGSANLIEISDGVFRVDGDYDWFTYSPISNLYQEQSNMNESNTGGLGSFTGVDGATLTAVIEDTFPSIRVVPTTVNSRLNLSLTATATNTWSGGDLPSFVPNTTYTITVDYKAVNGETVRWHLWDGSSSLVNLTDTATGVWTTKTFSFTVPSGGLTDGGGPVLYFQPSRTTGTQTGYYKNLLITE